MIRHPPPIIGDRASFVACSRGRRVTTAAFVLQVRQRADAGPARFGFTATKKLGKAVLRNRMRRRLKEAVRLTWPEMAHVGVDYVLVVRAAAVDRPFPCLCKDLVSAMTTANATLASAGGAPRADDRNAAQGSPAPPTD